MSGAGAGETRTLTSVPGLLVGHAHDAEARTGCTVVLGPFRAAAAIRGHATGTRELDALDPSHVVPRCDALLLTGGSAFGLAAADGVVRWLEERDRGFRTSAARVPIVPAAVLYDLAVGDSGVRPGPGMGYDAARAAHAGPVEGGPVGAGCGATVGKLRGGGTGDPAGIGSWADPDDEPAVAALAAVNAFGDVVDARGEILAGARADEGGFLDTDRALREGAAPAGFGGPRENTTLAVVATDAPLGRTALQVVARQAADGIARRVRPAATSFDGDVVFAVSTAAEVRTDLGPVAVTRIALRAARAVEEAVERAVRPAGAAG